MTTRLQLPDPEQVVFERSPLSLVVCQLRFEHLGEVERHQDALRERLADVYPNVQRLQSMELTLSPGGAQSTATAGLRFASIDGDWTFTLVPTFASLETTAYTDWDDFEVRLRDVTDALAVTAAPRVETRLGLRYVNRIELDAIKQPSDWTAYLKPAVAADLDASSPFGDSVLTLHQTMQLDVGDGARLTFRHGLPGEAASPDGPDLAYLLDFDCFREGERQLDAGVVLMTADRFNTVITSLFQWCLRDPLRKELQPRAK